MSSLTNNDLELFSYSEDPWRPATSDNEFRIRLIELQPANQTATAALLRCKIFWTPLVTCQAFKALSYTWGVDPPTSKIYVGDKYLPITPSLEAALQHIRDKEHITTIWIDQISINQRDTTEKNEQVSKMNQIYRAASEVVVWLGPTADDSDAFMEAWREVGKMVAGFDLLSYLNSDRIALFGRIVANVDPQDPATKRFQAIVNHTAGLLDEKMLRAMAAWERRPWFSRVWVVQEYTLGRTTTFMCGHKTISAELAQFARLIFDDAKDRIRPELHPLCIPLYNDPMHTFFVTKEVQRKFDAGYDKGHPLFQLLKLVYAGKNMQATNACDRIFALLGLAVDAKALGLQVDYAIADRVDLVFARTAKALVGKGEILAMSQFPKAYPGLPSWVPDLTNRIEVSFADLPMSDAFNLFGAYSGLHRRLLELHDDLVLGLVGCVVGEIEEYGEIWDGNEGRYEYENNTGVATKLDLHVTHEISQRPDSGINADPQFRLRGIPYNYDGYFKYLHSIRSFLHKSARKNHPIYPTEERRIEARWRLPVGDIELDEAYNRVRASESSAAAYDLCDAAFEFLHSYKSLPEPELRQAIAVWEQNEATRLPSRYRTCLRRMKNKRPFITKEGYVGMGPTCMEEGDLVVVLGLATLPYIVRRVENKSNEYLLLGECYCDGIMDGEIVAQREEQEFYFV